MFKVFRNFIKKQAKVSFTRPIQTFKFDFNLKVSIIELFKLDSNSEKFDLNLKKFMAGRLAPKVIFLRKSQVKSPKSQVMTLIFLKKQEKVKVMT
jgi:hypothetical protein